MEERGRHVECRPGGMGQELVSVRSVGFAFQSPNTGDRGLTGNCCCAGNPEGWSQMQSGFMGIARLRSIQRQ